MFSLNTIKKHAAKASHLFAFHVVFLTRGGSIMAIGYNHDRRHAEITAMQHMWKDQRPGLVCWSFRVTHGGALAMAKPCPACQKALMESGIYRVRYTTDEGKVVNLRLPEVQNG